MFKVGRALSVKVAGTICTSLPTKLYKCPEGCRLVLRTLEWYYLTGWARERSTCSNINPIQTGGGGAFDATQELNPYYSRTIASTVFLLRDVYSNLSGNNLVLSDFGS